jgi:hypothetical protein
VIIEACWEASEPRTNQETAQAEAKPLPPIPDQPYHRTLEEKDAWLHRLDALLAAAVPR